MKVLYFHQYFTTPQGSGGTRSYEMARRLVTQGHEVLVVCGSGVREVTGLSGPYVGGRRRGYVDGIEVLELDVRYANSVAFIKRAWIFLRFALRCIGVALTESYDVLFATSTPLTVALPGLAGRWLRGKPFVFEVRDLWPELPKAMGVVKNPLVLWGMAVLEFAAYRSAHRCIGLAPGIADGIARLGVDRSRIAMVPNGCDRDLFHDSLAPWRPEGINPESLLAVFAGAHGMANGLDAVVDAAAELDRRGRKDITILLVGEGMVKPRLQARAAEQGLRSLRFHPSVPKRQLASLMQATDIGLQVLANVPAFYFGTSPNKFFDYLSAGRPVLVNYPGWMAELVTEHHCGFAVPPEDAKAFADALERGADDREELLRMRTESHRLAAEFDRDVLGQRWVDWVIGADRRA
jgi:glycosyltransferase involved in cell wall biosynthesis